MSITTVIHGESKATNKIQPVTVCEMNSQDIVGLESCEGVSFDFTCKLSQVSVAYRLSRSSKA